MKTIVITGSTSGIGIEIIRLALQRGHCVIAIGRNDNRNVVAKASLSKTCDIQKLTFVSADLASFSQVREAAHQILQMTEECGIDALIHNAGIVPKWRLLSEEGYEMQFAVNHLSGFLLFSILKSRLIQTHGLMLTTASRSHRMAHLNFENLMLERGYHMLKAYKRSKLANVLFTLECNRRFHSQTGIVAIAMDPGLVNTDIGIKNTSGIENWFWRVRGKKGRLPQEIAPYYLNLIENIPSSPETGYIRLGSFLQPSKVSKDPLIAHRLWEVSNQLIGSETT